MLRAQLDDIQAANTWVADADENVESCGFKVSQPPGKVQVLDVDDLGWAAHHGIQPGDEIIAINTDPISPENMTPEIFVKKLEVRPLAVTVRRGETEGASPVGKHISVLPPSGNFITRLVIAGAKGLRKDEALVGWPDAFCKFCIEGKPGSAFKTDIVPKSSSPWWNHEVELTDFEIGDNLDFRIYDKDAGTRELLGKALIKSNSFAPDCYD